MDIELPLLERHKRTIREIILDHKRRPLEWAAEELQHLPTHTLNLDSAIVVRLKDAKQKKQGTKMLLTIERIKNPKSGFADAIKGGSNFATMNISGGNIDGAIAQGVENFKINNASAVKLPVQMKLPGLVALRGSGVGVPNRTIDLTSYPQRGKGIPKSKAKTTVKVSLKGGTITVPDFEPDETLEEYQARTGITDPGILLAKYQQRNQIASAQAMAQNGKQWAQTAKDTYLYNPANETAADKAREARVGNAFLNQMNNEAFYQVATGAKGIIDKALPFISAIPGVGEAGGVFDQGYNLLGIPDDTSVEASGDRVADAVDKAENGGKLKLGKAKAKVSAKPKTAPAKPKMMKRALKGGDYAYSDLDPLQQNYIASLIKNPIAGINIQQMIDEARNEKQTGDLLKKDVANGKKLLGISGGKVGPKRTEKKKPRSNPTNSMKTKLTK